MAGCSAESGAQLVARLSSVQRTSLENFYAPIFQQSDRPKQKQIVEIAGESGVGKTTLLVEMIGKTILPLKFGGKSAAVLFLLTDTNFQMLKFITIMEKHIRLYMISTCITENEVDLHQIIVNSLNNIVFIKCYSADEFEITLFNLRNTLTANVRYSLLAIDTIGSFYWLQKPTVDTPILRMDTYVQQLVTRIRKITEECGVLFMYTRLSIGAASQKMKGVPVTTVTYRIELAANEKSTSAAADKTTPMPDYYANVTLGQNERFVYAYSIDGCGINWFET